MKLNKYFLLFLCTFNFCNADDTTTYWTEFSFVLGISSIEGGGIGVFATHDLKAGTPVFLHALTHHVMNIKEVPTPFLKYVVYINDAECQMPEQCDRMEISWYLNHSFDPNLIIENSFCITKKDIQAGEEILIDYNTLGEPEHLKEDYFKKRS